MKNRNWLLAVLMFVLIVGVGIGMFSFPAQTAYAEDNTLYKIKFKCLPSDFENEGFGWIFSDKSIYNEELSLDGHYAKEGEIVTLEVDIEDERFHSLKRLYYVNASNPSVEVDIDLTTKKFAMPAFDIVVYGDFNEPTRYNITTIQGKNGKIYMREWAYAGKRWEVEIVPNAGYRTKSVYYFDSAGDRTDLEFDDGLSYPYMTMPSSDITVYVEFEKIPYSITIPDKVTVKRGEEILTNSDKVYFGDEITIFYDMPDHYEYTCKIKKDWISSGDTYTVKAEDVDIYFLLEQCEWQVSWQESEKYSISMDRYSEVVANNDWIYWDEDLFFTITPDASYRVTKVLMNGTVLSPDSEGIYNFLMPQETAIITVEGEDLFMMDWTDEDSHSFTIKKGDYVAESPDWFAKGETLTITVAPQPGYGVTKILANGVIISTSNEATYVMTEESVDFTAEVEKIVYSVIVYEWYPDYNGGTKEEFKYVDEQTATVGETVSILHRYNEKLYSCGDIFYVFLDDPRNFDTDEFNNAYNAYDNYYSADVWDESGIDFDTMPAGNIAVFFELYERCFRFDVPENVSITILESDGIVWETPDIYTNYKDLWINIFSKIKITIEQTDHFITKLYAYNSYFYSDVDSSLYLGDKAEITGVLYDLIESQFDKFITTGDATKLITTQTQFKWMLDWTDEDTHSFTIKSDEYVAESPDWFAKGETLTITVAPQPGYRVTKIFANGEVISTGASATYIMQEEDVDFTAEVEKIEYSIKKAESNGKFNVNKTSASAGDEIIISNIVPDAGYFMSGAFYIYTNGGTQNDISNNSFIMPNNAVTICVKFEKIAYSISIPDGVTVIRRNVVLTSADNVYIGDELTIEYVEQEHFDTSVEINGTMVGNGEKFIVGVENVVIDCRSVQSEWQILWQNGEDFEVLIKNGENVIENGAWFESGVELVFSVVLKNPETHEVTNVLINGNSDALNNNKFTTTNKNTTIVVVVEKVEIEVKNDSGHAIVVGAREKVKEATLDVDIFEETESAHADILERVETIKENHNVKKLRAYSVRLLKENQPVVLSVGTKLMLLLPEFYVENITILFKQTGENVVEHSYEVETIGDKMYAVLNVSELGIFAFANLEEKKSESKTLQAGEIFAIVFVASVFVGVGTMVSVAIIRKKKKLKKQENLK